MSTFDEIIATFAEQVKGSAVIEVEDIPNIDLYMDQVTTFMDKCLGRYKRFEEDKILTKTMINNYTKAKIFPPPVKKKYTRAHIMLLIMIYHLKSILSIRDIGILFRPVISEENLEKQGKFVLDIYKGFLRLQKLTQGQMKDSVADFPENCPIERELVFAAESEIAKKIVLVLFLAMRAYGEKQLAERVLDSYF